MTVEALRAPASRYEVPARVDLAEREVRERLTPAAVRSLTTLAEAWGLTVDDLGALLGGVPASTWHSWRSHPPVDLGIDRLMRVSYLLGIYSSLHALHSGPLADEWVRRPNTNELFRGRAPLEVLKSEGIPAMADTRSLLDARRGGL